MKEGVREVKTTLPIYVHLTPHRMKIDQNTILCPPQTENNTEKRKNNKKYAFFSFFFPFVTEKDKKTCFNT